MDKDLKQSSWGPWIINTRSSSLLQVAGPGGDFGGVSYGSATDSHRVYISIINNEVENFTLVPSKNVTQVGGWVGIDASNGTTLWTTATPGTIGNFPTGPVSVANGVLFTTSLGPLNGTLYALDVKTGGVLWEYKFNTAIYGGVAVVGDCVFLGQGIGFGFIGNHGGAVSAFCIERD
jgi:polyvinyl alcohol dehydrogenase (cytochrome)